MNREEGAKMTRISIVMCTRNRAERLALALERMLSINLSEFKSEFILVDNGSQDETSSVIQSFANRATLPIKHCYEPIAGLGRARNCGIKASNGDILVFTDDDCFFEINYFKHLLYHCQSSNIDFGGGQILPSNFEDDERVASFTFQKPIKIEPYCYFIKPGQIQGANMFFKRSVFDQVGGFRDDMGAGTLFPCEDIEMACRASNGGFSGILLPELKVFHDHRRRRDSTEALDVIRSYDQGRGGYFASLICEGKIDTLSIWMKKYLELPSLSRRHLEMLAQEMRAAANFIESQILAEDISISTIRRKPRIKLAFLSKAVKKILPTKSC